jgi:hypothetical protein
MMEQNWTPVSLHDKAKRVKVLGYPSLVLCVCPHTEPLSFGHMTSPLVL